MRNDVLIIGNGFDIYHKLPTRYTDFLFLAKNWDYFHSSYVEKISSMKKRGHIKKQFDVSVDERGRLTEEALDDFINNYASFNTDRINQLGRIITTNTWINYFLETNYDKEGWIDFEAEIEKVLSYIEMFFKEEIRKSEGKMLTLTINPLVKRLVVFLNANTKSFRCSLGMITKNDIDLFLYGDIKKNLIGELKDSLDELNNALRIYILEFVSKVKVKVFSEQISELHDINILNFNYTSTYNNVYGTTRLCEHNQIHGSCEKNNMVLGISDGSIDDTDYVYFQKYFQRIQKRTGIFYRNWMPYSEGRLIDTPIEVYIVGHSLGATDKGVLDDFFLNNRGVKRITIYHHDQEAYETLVIALVKLYGKDFVIEQTGKGRIEFVELKGAAEGRAGDYIKEGIVAD